jgi:enolase
LLHAKLGLQKKRFFYLNFLWLSHNCAAISVLFEKILRKNKHQVPLYKYIADLSGETSLTLPVPAFTLISGGKHAGNHLAIQVCTGEV